MLNLFPNFQSVRRVYRYEVKRLKQRVPTYTDKLLSQVLSKGYVVIPNYWSKDKCKLACESIDKLIAKSEVTVWKDKCNADLRIMGINNLNKELDLMNDPVLSEQLQKLSCADNLTGFCMAGKLGYVEGNQGSGQGWHRDIAVSYQFKAILYLTDVNTHTGPFQYYTGSGNALSMLNFERKNSISIDQCRFSNKEATLFEPERLVEVCAPAGTLIIANTRGIHRGKPIDAGQRYALTSYQWPVSIPKHIVPYVNGI